MSIPLRIIVRDDRPLDGVTDLPADAVSRITYDRRIGMQVIELQPGERFGRIGIGGPLGMAGTQTIRSLAVISAIGQHADGSVVSIQAPESPFVPGLVERVVLPLGPGQNPLSQGTGIWPEGINEPVPPAHNLSFNTEADGPNPGPHLIQINYEGARSEPFERPGDPFGVQAQRGIVQGSMFIQAPVNPVSTVIPAANVFVPVGNGQGPTHPVYVESDAPLIEFEVQGDQAENQVLVYTGTRQAYGVLALNCGSRDLAFGSEDLLCRVLRNGAPITQSGGGSESFSGFLGSQSSVTPLVVNPGDVFQVQVANANSGIDIVVDVSSLTFIGAQL